MNNYLKNVIKWKNITLKITILVCIIFAVVDAQANSVKDITVLMQTETVTLKMSNKSISDILSEIEKQTGIGYYVSATINKELHNISVNVENESVKNTLDKILHNTDCNYEIVNNAINIVKKREVAPSRNLLVQQTKKIEVKGKVVDEFGEPIVGATIIAVKSRNGSISDELGLFSFSLSSADVIEVTCLGYVEQLITIDATNTALTITMKIEEMSVKDVVVTGLGSVKKESFTGSATTVSGEELLRVSPTNILSALAVFDPSLRLMVNNDMGSDPNTLPTIYIRGQSGISGSTELDVLNGSVSEYELTNDPNAPLFILDGVEVDMSVIYDMDPLRIKSMTILKDAASTAIYGSRASNGVIVVETITPQAGKLFVNYSFNGSVTMPDISSYDLLNAEDKLAAEVYGGLLMSSDYAESTIAYRYRMAHYRATLNAINQGVDTDWLSYPLTVQFNQKHSLSIDGGSQDLRFGLNLSYNNSNGVMKESFRDNITAGFDINYTPNDKLRITNKISVTFNDTNDSPYGSYSDYTSQQPYWTPYDVETGDLVSSFRPITSERYANPLYSAELDSYNISNYFNISNNLGLDYYFNNNLRFTGTFSISYRDANNETFVDPMDINEKYSSIEERGSLNLSDNYSTSINVNAVFQYNKSFGGSNINARLGGNIKDSETNNANYSYVGFLNSSLVSPMFAAQMNNDPSFSDSNSRLAGAFLAVNYSYNDIYLFDISSRIDGSSQFGSNNMYAPFWALGTGLNIHNYNFMKSIDVVDILRVTANYGQTGRVNFSAYQAANTYRISTADWYPTGIGATLIARGNENLSWEKTNALNVSLDGAFLDKRLSVGLSYYNNLTVDLVSNVTIPVSTGFKTYKDNIGEVQNNGFEFDISYAIIKKKDMGLTATINGSKNVGKILKISDSQKAYNDAVVAYFESSSASNTNNLPILQYTENGSLTSIYGAKSLGVSPSTGQELYLTAAGNISTVWNSSDQMIIGDTEPDLAGSARLSFFYKNLSVYASFIYSIGGDVYNSTLANRIEGIDILDENVDARVLTDRWLEPGDLSAFTRINLLDNSINPTSRFVQNEAYLKFNSISCSYTLKTQKLKDLGISLCRFSLSMNDIFTISTIGQERGLSYPFARTVNLSANISF